RRALRDSRCALPRAATRLDAARVVSAGSTTPRVTLQIYRHSIYCYRQSSEGVVMGRLVVLALRVVIVLLPAGSLFIQGVMVPLLRVDLDEAGGDLSAVQIPVVVIVILGFVTAQVVLVCIWRLLTMVRRGTVFSHGAFRYVDIIIGAVVAAAVLIFGLA